MTQVDWYFDFISPFAYLQHEVLHRLPDHAEIVYKPILFAGLLNHFGHKGPAEIPSKRVFTYQHTLWLARREGIPLNAPQKHPFNPLPFLRMALALGPNKAVVQRIFKHIWVDGADPTDMDAALALGRELGLDDPTAAVAKSQVKSALMHNGKEAVARGVFGVPTIAVGPHLFWGYDATDMAGDYLLNPDGFFDQEMKAAAALPVGVHRR